MTQAELNERIKKHMLWLQNEEGGEKLVIGAEDDVRGLKFIVDDLRCASFRGANLSNVWFKGCDLQNVSFDGAVFDRTDFEKTTISYNEDLFLKLAENIKKSRKKRESAMNEEEQFDKLFEALKGLDYGTWLRLKSSIDVEFDYLQSTNTLTEENVRRVYESLPSNRKENQQ